MGTLIQANTSILDSMAGLYNLGITNLDSASTPAFTGLVEVNGAMYKFTNETPTGISSITNGASFYVSVVPSGSSASLVCEAVTGYTVDQAKNGVYDSTGAKRAVLQANELSDTYTNKRVIKSAQEYNSPIMSLKLELEAYAVVEYLDDLYDYIQSYIPNIGDSALLNGSIAAFNTTGSKTYLYVPSVVKRTNTTEITIKSTALLPDAGLYDPFDLVCYPSYTHGTFRITGYRLALYK